MSFKIAVQTQDRGVVGVLFVSFENAMEAAENSVLPFDQSAVTIEGENFEPAEVEHGSVTNLGARALGFEAGQRRRLFGRFNTDLRIRAHGGGVRSWSSDLRRKKLCTIQQRATERGVVTAPRTFKVGFSLEMGSHRLHLGVQIIHVMQ